MSNSKNFKIYLVSIQYPPNITGGGGVIVRELSRELVKNNKNVTVLCFGLKDKKDEILTLSDKDGIFKVPVKRFFSDDSNLIKNPYQGSKEDEFKRFEEFIEKIFRFLKNKKGLIHLHGHYLVPFLAKKLKMEGNMAPIITSYHALESIALEKKNIKNIYAINYIREKERESLKYCDLAIVNSKKVKYQLNLMYPEEFNQNKVAILPNPVNNELIYFKKTSKKEKLQNRKKYNLKEDSNLIFSIGRIDKIKGYDILIESLYHVGKMTEKNISLVIAGFLEDKNIEYYNILNELAFKIKDRYSNIEIIFIPNISNEEKIKFLDDCICFITAAILEPFGITTLESWIREKPVITSETEGSKDLFNIKKNEKPMFLIRDKGLIVSNQNDKRENFAKAIIYLLNNIEESLRMGKYGKEFVLKNYTWKSIVKKYIEKYDSLINN
ncbi:MAG: glycosyltransferase family 1 protein [Candidatus Lokiarchaeota archaeon]|nr:glycosyltransferase family 1 protein [Candidatus Lokiarchaeota archaeon]